MLDVLRPVNREGSHHGETKCIPTTTTYSKSQLNTQSTVEYWRNSGKMKLNEPGRQKLGRPRYRIPVSRNSTQSYIVGPATGLERGNL